MNCLLKKAFKISNSFKYLLIMFENQEPDNSFFFIKKYKNKLQTLKCSWTENHMYKNI